MNQSLHISGAGWAGGLQWLMWWCWRWSDSSEVWVRKSSLFSEYYEEIQKKNRQDA